MSDGLIAAAYVWIPISLIVFVRKRHDLSFTWVFTLFGAFILLCGLTHLMDVATLWIPAYGLMVVFKSLAAIVSVATAAVLSAMMPRFLSIPSSGQLLDANRRLQDEVHERLAAEDRLHDLAAALESRVTERTIALTNALARLEGEVAQRKAYEERFHHAIESAPSAMIMVNEHGTIEMVNAQAERTFGYSREELLAKSSEILLPERYWGRHSAAKSSFFADASPRQMGAGQDLFGLRKDGSEFPLEIGLSTLTTTEGCKVVSSIVDITKRREIEKSLNESEQQTRVMFDSIKGQAIFMLDARGRIATWNIGAERLKGYPRDEILGQHFSLFYPAEDVANNKPANLLIVAASQGRTEDEGWRIKQDGTRFMANVIISAIKAADGKIKGFVKVTRDVTDRKEIERQMIETNQRFAVGAQAAHLGFWEFDLASLSLRWDDLMYDIYGLPRRRGEQPFSMWSRNVHADDLERAERELHAAIKGTSPFDTKFRIVRPDGTVRHVRAAAQVERDHLGNAVRVLGVNFDVTHAEEAERRSKDALDLAEAASRAKSDFLAVMSHEIRTPMNGIMGMNALLLDTDLTPPQRKMAQTLHHAADSLLTIIDDILDISKLESGNIELEDVAFSMTEVVERVVDLMKPRAKSKDLYLSADQVVLPDRAFQGDPTRLRQVLLNLATNAIKFTPKGGVQIVARVLEEDRRHARIRFEVKDTGPGISDSIKERLFQPFQQADSGITRRFGGTGLGLSICKKLIRLMDGKLGVMDRSGGGSVFWFEIVLSFADERHGSGRGISDGGDILETARPVEGRILLAEDNNINVELATMVLEAAGYTIDIALNGDEALASAAGDVYDLILMDMQMPERDGLAATREIRSWGGRYATVLIVALTANAMKNDQQRCLDAGMNDYLSKPFAPVQLLQMVSRWITRSEPSSVNDQCAHDAPEGPVIDLEQVALLQATLPDRKVVALLRLYLIRSEELIRDLVDMNPATMLPEIGRISHKLVPTAATFGARRLQHLAERLQCACHGKNVKAAAELLVSMGPAAKEANAALSHMFETQLAGDYSPKVA